MAEEGVLERIGRRLGLQLPDDPLSRLEERLSYRFRNRDLLERALTHRSFANEQGLEGNYERLEFLGDSVLGFLASDWLFRRHPELSEGKLSTLKSSLVSRPTLERRAVELEVGPALRLGVGEDRSGGRAKGSLLADALEAVLGAVFLDRGIEAARRVIEPLFDDSLDELEEVLDGKTRLQELAQSLGLGLPAYRLLGETGPDHEKLFTVECRLGEQAATAEASTKKRAEKRAAAAVAELLTSLPTD
jgi:ribonuclease-3